MADTVDVVVGANKTRYASAKEAGAAFFEADITQRPGVIHGMPAGPGTGPGGSGRFMAETAVHGEYEDGSKEFLFGYDQRECPINPSRFVGMTRDEAFELKRVLDRLCTLGD